MVRRYYNHHESYESSKLCGEAEALQEGKASFCHLEVSSYHVLIEIYSNCRLANEGASLEQT